VTQMKVDECLPEECAELLTRKGHDVATARQEGLQGARDAEIWDAAQSEKRFLVTTDLDFSDLRRYRAGKHAGVLLLRLHKEGKTRVLAYLQWLLAQYDISKWESCLVVATDHKIRIRRPTLTPANTMKE
jgi:predicted nuclease of predicted toxin-antitoxin system